VDASTIYGAGRSGDEAQRVRNADAPACSRWSRLRWSLTCWRYCSDDASFSTAERFEALAGVYAYRLLVTSGSSPKSVGRQTLRVAGPLLTGPIGTEWIREEPAVLETLMPQLEGETLAGTRPV
jgi:hypothetical protein